MNEVLLGVGAIGFIGYLIWLIVRIKNWDSKIPPIIGMLMCLVMIAGGISTMPGVDLDISSRTGGSTSAKGTDSQDSQPEADVSQQTGPGYEVTYQNARTWTDSIGSVWVQVIVEISNTGSENLYLGSSAYDLEDAGGALISSKTMVSTYPSVLAPGEKGYMYEETILDNYNGDGQLSVVPRLSVEESKVPLIRYDTSDISVSDGSYGDISVLGRLENTTSSSADGLVYIVAFFYDESGAPIGSALNILTDGLESGSKVGFELNEHSMPKDVTSQSIANTVVYSYPLQYQF